MSKFDRKDEQLARLQQQLQEAKNQAEQSQKDIENCMRAAVGDKEFIALFLKRVIKNVRSHDFYSPFYSFLASRYLFRVTICKNYGSFFFGFYVFYPFNLFKLQQFDTLLNRFEDVK